MPDEFSGESSSRTSALLVFFSIHVHLRPLKLPCNVNIEGFRFQRTHKFTAKQVMSVYLGKMIENILKSNLSVQYPSVEK